MSVNNVLADSLARIKNAQSAKMKSVELYYSKLLLDCLFLLKKEGYISDFYTREIRKGVNRVFVILKYYNNSGVIADIKVFSRPGNRVYRKSKEIGEHFGKLGVLVLSTSKGVFSGRQASGMKCGGELLFGIY